MKIAHISDLHFGRIVVPGIVDHIIQDIRQMKVSLVAVSGGPYATCIRCSIQAGAGHARGFLLPPVIGCAWQP